MSVFLKLISELTICVVSLSQLKLRLSSQLINFKTISMASAGKKTHKELLKQIWTVIANALKDRATKTFFKVCFRALSSEVSDVYINYYTLYLIEFQYGLQIIFWGQKSQGSNRER